LSNNIFISYNAEFDYKTVSKDDIEMVYETNMLRIKFKDDKDLTYEEKSFGTIKDLDNTLY